MNINEILVPTRKYEEINLLKGFSGLYYRFARNLSLAMFGLLLLSAVSTDEIFYDKGIAQFTLTQTKIGNTNKESKVNIALELSSPRSKTKPLIKRVTSMV